jgi:hypothetical protein
MTWRVWMWLSTALHSIGDWASEAAIRCHQAGYRAAHKRDADKRGGSDADGS